MWKEIRKRFSHNLAPCSCPFFFKFCHMSCQFGGLLPADSSSSLDNPRLECFLDFAFFLDFLRFLLSRFFSFSHSLFSLAIRLLYILSILRSLLSSSFCFLRSLSSSLRTRRLPHVLENSLEEDGTESVLPMLFRRSRFLILSCFFWSLLAPSISSAHASGTLRLKNYQIGRNDYFLGILGSIFCFAGSR